jgi:hypothetical protein
MSACHMDRYWLELYFCFSAPAAGKPIFPNRTTVARWTADAWEVRRAAAQRDRAEGAAEAEVAAETEAPPDRAEAA